mgnify:CR=1 FL=1
MDFLDFPFLWESVLNIIRENLLGVRKQKKCIFGSLRVLVVGGVSQCSGAMQLIGVPHGLSTSQFPVSFSIFFFQQKNSIFQDFFLLLLFWCAKLGVKNYNIIFLDNMCRIPWLHWSIFQLFCHFTFFNTIYAFTKEQTDNR